MDSEHQQFVLETIRNVKIAAAHSGNWFAIFDRDECMACLDPVTWQDVDDPDSIERLARWRESAQNSFPAIFPVTLEGTRRWLIKQVLELPDRLLFWVKSSEGEKIGHAGIYRIDFEEESLELDNVVRGMPRVMRGAMYSGVQAILELGVRHAADERCFPAGVFRQPPSNSTLRTLRILRDDADADAARRRERRRSLDRGRRRLPQADRALFRDDASSAGHLAERMHR